MPEVTTTERATESALRGRARSDLTLGLIGSIMVCLGAFGVGDPPRNSALLTDLHLSAITYGHGKNLSAIVFWAGVAAMVIAWVRVGRRISRGGEQAPSVRSLRRWVLAWAAPLMVTVPVYSRDVYAYLAQGALFGAGFNPYADGPVSYTHLTLPTICSG